MSRTANLKVGSPAQLLLERADGSSCAIHPLWLSERYRDAASMDLKTQQRLQDPSDFDLNLKIVALAAREHFPSSLKTADTGKPGAWTSSRRPRWLPTA
jgi:hypothetical protein